MRELCTLIFLLNIAFLTASCETAVPSEPAHPSGELSSANHEPHGYEKIFEWDAGHDFPPHYGDDGCDQVTGLEGSAVGDLLGGGYDHEDNADIGMVDDAPVSGPEVLNFKYPAGKKGESNGVNMWAWKTPTGDPCDIVNASSEQYRKVYIREIRKIWTDRADGTVESFQSGNGFKFSHVKADISGSRPDGFSLTLGVSGINSSSPTHMSRFPLKVRNQWYDVDGDSHTETRHSKDSVVLVGAWQEVEWLVEVNTIAADGSANPDGRIRGWIDGDKVIDWQGVRMRSGHSEKTSGLLQSYDLVTTWSGGPDNVHTHDKGFYVDHVYVSGVR